MGIEARPGKNNDATTTPSSASSSSLQSKQAASSGGRGESNRQPTSMKDSQSSSTSGWDPGLFMKMTFPTLMKEMLMMMPTTTTDGKLSLRSLVSYQAMMTMACMCVYLYSLAAFLGQSLINHSHIHTHRLYSYRPSLHQLHESSYSKDSRSASSLFVFCLLFLFLQ
jgi:hypothetical protein